MARLRTQGLVELSEYDAGCYSKIERLMVAEKINILALQCVGPNGLYALRVSKRTGLPLVVTTQGEITMDASGLYQRSRFANANLLRLCKRAAVVTAVSRKTADDLIAQIGMRPPDLRVISNGADLDEFSSAKRANTRVRTSLPRAASPRRKASIFSSAPTAVADSPGSIFFSPGRGPNVNGWLASLSI